MGLRGGGDGKRGRYQKKLGGLLMALKSVKCSTGIQFMPYGA